MQACTPGNGSAGQLTYGSGLIGVREQAPLRRGWKVSREGNLPVITCACLACKAPSVSVMKINGFGVGVLDDLTSMESGISPVAV